MGELLNITFQQIQKYEKGVNRVSGGRLSELSKILDVPVSYFFEGIDDDTKDSNEAYKKIDYDSLNKEILTISRLLRGIKSEKKKRHLIEMIKSNIKFLK